MRSVPSRIVTLGGSSTAKELPAWPLLRSSPIASITAGESASAVALALRAYRRRFHVSRRRREASSPGAGAGPDRRGEARERGHGRSLAKPAQVPVEPQLTASPAHGLTRSPAGAGVLHPPRTRRQRDSNLRKRYIEDGALVDEPRGGAVKPTTLR